MLGRLARWMRIFGHDVLYFPDIEDRDLVRIAREQGRIIITRDRHFLTRKGLQGLVFIKTNDIRSQIREVAEMIGLHGTVPFGRCPVCNGELGPVEKKESIQEAVPEHIYHVCSDFIKCANCGKVYWEGTHFQGIQGTLRDITKGRFED